MSNAVTVAYNNEVIHEADFGETFTMNTEEKYLEGDIVVEVQDVEEANGNSF